MRYWVWAATSVVAGGVLIVLCGCQPRSPASATGDDVLVLELGGGHGKLREALQAVAPRYGITVAAVAPVTPPPVTPSPPASAPVPPPSEASPLPESAPAAGADAQASPPHVVVLGENETVYDLARKHLGSGARWPEILKLNGWTEREARRLRAGTQVKLP